MLDARERKRKVSRRRLPRSFFCFWFFFSFFGRLCVRFVGVFEGIINDRFEMFECGLSIEMGRTKIGCLVWREAVIVGEIAAHPPNLTELFTFTTSEGFKVCTAWIDKGIIIQSNLIFSIIIGV